MLDVNVLGPMIITAGSKEVTVDRPLERALLVRLALGRGSTVFDDRLADDLWTDVDSNRPIQRLRVVASRLRAALGEHADLLVRTSGGYRLTARMPDLLAAETAAQRLHTAARDENHAGVREAANAALANWRGPAFAGLHAFAFARAEATRLEHWRLDLTVHRLRAQLALGADTEMLTELTALTAAHPLHEPLHGLLAQALFRTGRRSAALEALARLRTNLIEELGVDPAPNVVDLERRISEGDQTLLRDPATTAERRTGGGSRAPLLLPVTSSRFVGRDAELTAVLEGVRGSGVTALVGAAGVGKSRLAAEVARAGAAERPVVLVELAPLRRGDAVVTAIADAAGVDSGAPDPLPEAAAALVGSLLVLDNAEHVVEAVCSAVLALLRATSDLHVMVTTQRALLIGERTHRVLPLDQDAATDLFTERAAADAISASGDAEAVAAICRAVDGLPLGIELAAGLTRALTVAQVAARVGDRLRLLVGGGHDAGRRHTSLRAALDWSHELLAPREQAVLRRIGVFAGGFVLEAAETVAAGGVVEPGDVAPALSDLVDRSLLAVVDDATGGRRFVMLESVRDYALARLADAGEADPTRQRHLSWCLAHVQRHAPQDLPMSADGIGAVFAEWPNLVEALERAPGTARAVDGFRLAEALYDPWHARGWFAEAPRHFTALADAPGVDPTERVLAMSKLAFHALMSGRLDEAAEMMATAAELARSLDDDSVTTTVLYHQGIVDVQRGRLIPAIDTLTRAENIALGMGAERRASSIGDALASAMLYAGDVTTALRRYEEGVEFDRKDGDEHRLAVSLHNLAEGLIDANRFDEAGELADESDHYATRLEDRQVAPLNAMVRAAVALAAGRLEDAEAHARRALSFAADAPVMAHVELAHVLLSKGELTEAARLLDIVGAGEQGRGTTWLAALPTAAALALARGDAEGARAQVQEAAQAYAAGGFGWRRYVARLYQVQDALAERARAPH